MDKSLTVVLPVHNAVRTLARDVRAALDASAELTSRIELIIIDNGSTDDSFDAASELAIEFPQVRVVRRSQQAGLAEALQRIRTGVRSDIVIVHDGVAPINTAQLRKVWDQQQAFVDRGPKGVSFADLRRPAATQPAMEDVHRRLRELRESTLVPEDEPPIPDGVRERRDTPSRPEPARKPGVGVGAIPQLPAMRPGVLGALSEFARGE